jgi:hypothetical protein
MALLRGENFFLEIGHMGYQKIKNFMPISQFFHTLYDLFQEYKISPFRRAIFKFINKKNKKD